MICINLLACLQFRHAVIIWIFVGAILIRLERIGLEVKESFSLQQWRGGEGQKMEGKGREENSFHSTFLAHFVFILYSKSNMSPLEGRLQAISLFWQSLLP